MSLTIIKIGSNVLVDDNNELRLSVIENILQAISEKVKQGQKIVLVTSGAVALGRKFFANKALDKKLAAGIGQLKLMSGYNQVASKLGLTVSELLLSRPHLVQRPHFLELQKSIESAFENNIIPIVNENDALVYGTDWSFGDNDSLGASLAVAFKADKLLILSHVEGLFTGNPEEDKEAKLLSVVKDVNAELMKYCSGDVSDKGRGGMISKLKAARLCTAVGIEVQIISGFKKENIVVALSGGEVGTTFLSRKSEGNIKNRERWLMASKTSAASILVDEGASGALEKGKSLLAVGIKKIYGVFNEGEIVELINEKKEGIAFGVVDVSSRDLEDQPFKSQKGVQVMHADNLIFFG